MPTLPVAVKVFFYDTDAGFLRAKTRIKDSKAHRYWSIVENRRTRGNRVVQRQVLYLGEINVSGLDLCASPMGRLLARL